MNYYILINNSKKNDISSPINGVLAEEFDAKNPFPAMKYAWTKPRDIKNRVYPQELFFIVKNEKKFNLDYASYWDGYIISEEFKEIIDRNKCQPYKKVKLMVINTKGEKIANNRNYYFIDMRASTLDAIDYKNSQFTIDNDMIKLRGLSLDSLYLNNNFFGNIKSYEKLSLDKEEIYYDVFTLKDTIIHDIICNQNVNEQVINQFSSIRSIDFKNISEYFKRFR